MGTEDDRAKGGGISMETKPVIEVRNVTIQFGSLKANSDVSFSVRQGELFGLIGPNGAGKTTKIGRAHV